MMPGNDIVVHVPGFARDQFDAGNAFFLGFVREHRARDDVADRVNAGDIGAEHFIHFDPAALVERDADFVRADAFRKSAATDGDEDFVGFEIEFLAAFVAVAMARPFIDFDRANLGLEMELDSLRGEGALEEIGCFEIEADARCAEEIRAPSPRSRGGSRPSRARGRSRPRR